MSAAASGPEATAPVGGRTRFAPAPTGWLHLGHLVNAIYVWGLARATRREVILRIEDHDRQRSRHEHEAALLDDLDRLGLAAARPSTSELRAGQSAFRQSDCGPIYAAALERLDAAGLVYRCDCTRSTFSAWSAAHGRPWAGSGCPGGCRARNLPAGANLAVRVSAGDGTEAWIDRLAGEREEPVNLGGDPAVRDRLGNWTYLLCVVVDDIRHGIDLVVRGEDLVESTPAQIRLARLLGRTDPPSFAHHPLLRRPDGSKLSKAEGATAVRDLLDAGRTPADLFGDAAAAIGLVQESRPISPAEFAAVVGARDQPAEGSLRSSTSQA